MSGKTIPRAREAALELLPPVDGRLILDLGCGAGNEARALAARGARVIGVDAQAEPPFVRADLRSLELDVEADGIWSSFAVAYMPDLTPVLSSWRRLLKPNGWIALLEIDDFFAHEPLSARTKSLLDGNADEALATGRYDFHMGHKLAAHLSAAGFTVETCTTLPDRELSFDGSAGADVIELWRARFARLGGLQAFCGNEFDAVREEFLACLARDDHRSDAKVWFCLARMTP